MKHPNSLFVAAVLLPLAAWAQSPGQEPGQPDPQPSQQGQGATFESLDTNADGRISKTEAEANASVKAQFSSYDLNGNGFIEREEVTSAQSPRSEPPQQ